MARYRHYLNNKDPGVTLFATTTVLDFVHAFARKEPRSAMVREIAWHCTLRRAALYSYVVMPHHIHFIIRLHEKMNGPTFMRAFKSQSSDSILKLLSPEERLQFDQQRGLNGNTFWKYSFRSKLIEDEETFWQKLHYIHMNPVHAGYVDSPEDYLWSSAKLIQKGLWSQESGLSYEDVASSLGAGSEDGESEAKERLEA